MARDYRYPLTRICLRSGELTLPRTMLELFPHSGTVTAYDTVLDAEVQLVVRGPRKVGGLADYFSAHDLDVNDTLLIRPLEDGRYALTAVARPRRRDYDRPEAWAALREGVLEAGPLTEAEIRTLHPDLPADLDLREALEEDPRLHFRQGRWRRVEAPDEPQAEAPATAERGVDAARAVSTSSDAPAPEALSIDEPAHGAPEADPAPERTPRGRKAAAPRTEGGPAGETPQRRATVTPYPRGVMFPGDAALNSEQEADDDRELELQNRARDALVDFGFRVEGLPRRALMAHAELGRRHYVVLVHVLPDGERLDWAALLARRRETGATYLAVFGDHRDLHRLSAPADLARATLWSWAGVARVRDLTRTVAISPYDLEPHFRRDGLFDHGIERFERSVGQRVAERGVFSAVVSRLATLRAPAVFLLEDVADRDVPRDQALQVLELLAQAPFHLVTRVDSGEFCLRYRVHDGLLQLSEYALSLRDRLPNRRRERVLGTETRAPAAPGRRAGREGDAESDPAAERERGVGISD